MEVSLLFVDFYSFYIFAAYLLRKAVDDFLFWLVPNSWVPLYNSVSFTHMPYKKCIENRAWQDKMLNNAIIYGGFVAVCAISFGAFAARNTIDWNSFNVSSLIDKIKFSK